MMNINAKKYTSFVWQYFNPHISLKNWLNDKKLYKTYCSIILLMLYLRELNAKWEGLKVNNGFFYKYFVYCKQRKLHKLINEKNEMTIDTECLQYSLLWVSRLCRRSSTASSLVWKLIMFNRVQRSSLNFTMLH